MGSPVASGTRLACDVGRVRIGVARCDPAGQVATPLPAIAAGPDAYSAVMTLVDELQVVEVIVGLPKRMDGTLGPAAILAQEWADGLAAALDQAGSSVPISLVDERLTTVEAQRGLHAAGATIRSSRQRIDSAAATVLLQSYLDRRPGH